MGITGGFDGFMNTEIGILQFMVLHHHGHLERT